MNTLSNNFYSFDKKKDMSLGYKKSIILNNIARTKGVDKFCNKILEIINHPRSKLYPEMILNDIKNFCEKRLETNKQVRIESNDILKNLNKDNYINDEGVEWIK